MPEAGIRNYKLKKKLVEQELFAGAENLALIIPDNALPEDVVLRWQTRHHREYLDKRLNFYTTEKKDEGYQFEFPF